ncbi:hypothetical protein C8J57DRAFT_1214000 [Mycena rebaudengoi]|nr:hypothetical protein C8J57DRAFT_1214000 [Mycena rebaudengoi]
MAPYASRRRQPEGQPCPMANAVPSTSPQDAPPLMTAPPAVRRADGLQAVARPLHEPRKASRHRRSRSISLSHDMWLSVTTRVRIRGGGEEDSLRVALWRRYSCPGRAPQSLAPPLGRLSRRPPASAAAASSQVRISRTTRLGTYGTPAANTHPNNAPPPASVSNPAPATTRKDNGAAPLGHRPPAPPTDTGPVRESRTAQHSVHGTPAADVDGRTARAPRTATLPLWPSTACAARLAPVSRDAPTDFS